MDVLFNSFNERLAAWRSKSSASDATQAAQAVTGAAALTAWDIFNYLNTTAQAVVGATYLTAVDITNRVGVTSGVKAATELLYAGVAKAQEVADPDTATKVRWCEGQPCGYMLKFVFMLLLGGTETCMVHQAALDSGRVVPWLLFDVVGQTLIAVPLRSPHQSSHGRCSHMHHSRQPRVCSLPSMHVEAFHTPALHCLLVRRWCWMPGSVSPTTLSSPRCSRLQSRSPTPACRCDFTIWRLAWCALMSCFHRCFDLSLQSGCTQLCGC